MTASTTASLSPGKDGILRILDRRYLVRIHDIALDTIWVSFPAASFPYEGLGADLELHDPYGYVTYHTRVVLGPREKGDGVILQRAEAATYLQHRRTWRVPVNLRVWFRASADTRDEEGRANDLSAEGMQIIARPGRPVGEELVVKLDLPSAPAFNSSARIVHEQSDDGRWARYGLRFADVSPENRRILADFLHGRIRKHYRKELRDLYPRSRNSPKK